MMLRKTENQTNMQMKSPTQAIRLRIWIALGVASFLSGLIAFAPARLAEGVANRALAPQARVQIADGTFWSGRGAMLLRSGGSANEIPFTWRFDALALLRLRAGVALSADSAALAGTVKVALGFRTIEIRDANLRMDASLITAINSMAALLGPAGTLQLDTRPGESIFFNYRGPQLINGNLKLRTGNVMLRSVAPRVFGATISTSRCAMRRPNIRSPNLPARSSWTAVAASTGMRRGNSTIAASPVRPPMRRRYSHRCARSVGRWRMAACKSIIRLAGSC